MASELVGGAFLSATVQVAFDRLASRDILDYFRGRKLKDGLLKKLRITLISINQVLEDAEERQYRNPNVKQWLDELKDAVFRAEDLLDEIATEASREKLDAEFQTATNKVRGFFTALVNPFDKEVESRIQEVLETLEFLKKQKDVLGLKEGSGASSEVGVGRKLSRRLPTTSSIDESNIYGRDVEKETIIKFLLSNNFCGSQIPVITIMGMGGIGKTTLAQLVYNDKQVEDRFHLRAWVCISEEFDAVRITKLILEALGCSTNRSKDLNVLQLELKERLMGKKFLLVLDDVWNENRTSWDDLLCFFNHGAFGSKILVTTRSEKVASMTRSIQVYHLKQLEEEDCWNLFSKYAFHDMDAGRYPHLKLVGEKIVEKCKGLPLAIKTLGSLLHKRLSYQEWNKILESDIWCFSEDESNIIPALRLSYHYLPSNLKRCFAFCAIFPKDYVIDKHHLIQLWMAEGLLYCHRSDVTAEELGNEFFNDLVSRSFFQQSRGDGRYFIMHDLLNDLAKFVSGEFCLRLEDERVQDISVKARHFSYLSPSGDTSKLLKSIYECKLLRSFMPLAPEFYNKNINAMHDLLLRLKYLRILYLFGCLDINEFVDDISNLKHLRYLDLSFTVFKRLPDSFCALNNLQTLKLDGCGSLVELPPNMYKLINLHYLSLSNSGISKLPDSICLLQNLHILKLYRCSFLAELPSNLHKLINLHRLELTGTEIKEMPMHIGRLKDLEILTDFFVGKQTGPNIKELGKLYYLQGTLRISQLENIGDAMDAMAANMKDKKYLDGLELEWSNNHEDSQNERCVLEALQPDRNLKELAVRSYGGTRFADWFDVPYLPNLVCLVLKECKYCFSLPSLGQLPALEKLCISQCDGIKAIGPEFYGNISTSAPFKCLKILEFEYMSEWEEWKHWEGDAEGECFSCLQELYIGHCPRLTKSLPPLLPSLRKLIIKHCQELEASVPKAICVDELSLITCKKMSLKDVPTSLRVIHISETGVDKSFLQHILLSNPNLERLTVWVDFGINLNWSSSLPCCNSIRFLHINCCNSMKHLSLDLFPSLCELTLFACPELKSFSIAGSSPLKLESISLGNLSNLKSLPENMHALLPSLHYLSFSDCPELESLPQGGLPSNLIILSISGCPKLVASHKDWGLHKLHSLRCFAIGDDFENAESFPEEGLLPANLQSLCFLDCTSLKTINYKGLLHLKSLESLDIYSCPCLRDLPEKGFPKSLSRLTIEGNCPLLKQRYQKEIGQDWPKISHIPCVRFR